MMEGLKEIIVSLHFFDWMTIALLIIGIIITVVSGSWIQKNKFEVSSGNKTNLTYHRHITCSRVSAFRRLWVFLA